MLVLINPDNPSGNYIPKDDVLYLASWCEKKGIRLLVDESFSDFAEEFPWNSLLCNSILEKHTNLMVMKSISKSYGVPGLRLGVFASSDTRLIAQMKKEASIWNINSFAEFFLQIYGKYEKDYIIAHKKFIEERKTFYNELQEIPFLRVIPSQANYFLCEVTGKYTSNELAENLMARDVIISDCGRKSNMKEQNLIRLAIRSREDNSRLIEILKSL